jgi:alpha-galactosidase
MYIKVGVIMRSQRCLRVLGGEILRWSGIFLLVCIALNPASAVPAGRKYWAADIHPQPFPGVRLTSGLTVCDEVLWKARWVNRYWLSTGFIEPEFHYGLAQEHREGLPIDGFQLAMEGQDLAGTWRWVKAEKSEVHNPDGLLVTLELASTARPITVKVHTLLYGGPVMVRWIEIINTGTKPTAITAVAPWSGLIWDTPNYSERLPKGTASPFEVGYAQYEAGEDEGAWTLEPVENTTKTISGTRGRSGWGHPTFFAHNKATGEWFVASLGWSANWTYQVSGQQSSEADRATLLFRMGPRTVDPVLRVLAPGETMETPRTHVLCMRGDLDAVIQALHEHVRREVLPPPVPGRDMLVEANHRGYIVDHESEAGIDKEIDLAAESGAEMFVIDAGWFGPEPNNWGANVGDWYAGAWLPHDVNPIREHARQKGLLFGLWVEIESVGSASHLRQQHPDWVLRDHAKITSQR